MEIVNDTDRINSAGVHLNICAIKSQLGDHHSAVLHAQRALFLTKSVAEYTNELVVTLGFAYMNLGIETSLLGGRAQSSRIFKEGWDMARQYIGPHLVTQQLKEYYRNSIGKTESAKRKSRSHQATIRNPHGTPKSKRIMKITRFITGDKLIPMFNAPPKTKRLKTRALKRSVRTLIWSKDNTIRNINITPRDSIQVLSDNKPEVTLTDANRVIQRSWRSRKAKEQGKFTLTHIENPLTPVPLRSRLPQIGPKAKIASGRVSPQASQLQVIVPWLKSILVQKHFKSVQNAAIKIQSWVRGLQTQRLFESIKAASVFIQREFKGYRARKLLR